MPVRKPPLDLTKALLDPTAVFGAPEDVVDAPDLPRDMKVKILRRWEYDARELEVAEEENMPSTQPGLLHRVLKALDALGAEADLDHAPPTKQGGE